LLVAGFFTLSVPGFAKRHHDFGTKLPRLTLLVVNMPLPLVWIVAAAALRLPAVLVAACWRSPGARLSRIVSRVPLAGPLVRWSGLARFCQLMAMLLEANVPAAEALRLPAGGVSHAGLADAAGF
jgi:type II secretory pathway component PulF